MDHVMPATDLRGWLPVRTLSSPSGISFELAFFGDKLATEPFFHDTANRVATSLFNNAFRRPFTAEALARAMDPEQTIEPTAFVIHASRCGSTLLMQMLAALESHVAISEPPMLDTLLRSPLFANGNAQEYHVACIRTLLSALAQRRRNESQYVVKLDAWNIFELPLLLKAFPKTPWIYLYRDPLEIAVSQLRQRASYMIPGVSLASGWQPSLEEALAMGAEAYVARVLGKLFQESLNRLKAHNGELLHYRELPSAAWTSCKTLLGIADGDSIETMQRAAKWNAKHPGIEFVEDTKAKQNEASPQLREFIEEFAMPHYRALEAMREARVG